MVTKAGREASWLGEKTRLIVWLAKVSYPQRQCVDMIA